MPNIITHTIFSEEVYKKIKNEKYRHIIDAHKQEYLIGTNGPDYLFFYDVFPLTKKQDMRISNIGTSLHNKEVNTFFKSAIESYQKQEAGAIKDAMASYIIGHYLHWQLDSVMHPYVVYFTGFKTPQSKEYHHRFESMMDTINLKKYHDKSIRTYKTYRNCARSDSSVAAISNVYIPAVRACFDMDIDAVIVEKALKDWEKAQRYLYDPIGIKYRLLRIVETISRNRNLSGNIVRRKEDKRYDVMNRKHEAWQHPCTGEPSNESENALFKKAIKKAKEGLGYVFDALDGESVEPLLTFIGDRNYSNGVRGKLKRLYKDEIYEMGEK